MTVRRSLVLATITALSADLGHAQSGTLCDQPFDGDIVGLPARIKEMPGAVAVQSPNADFEVISVEPQGDIWNFTNARHPAHPSVACRRLIQEGGSFRVRTEIQCRAAKPRCDKLAAEYDALDKAMSESIRRRFPNK